MPLGLCQGDCDSDDECKGELICFINGEGDGNTPEGCGGTAEYGIDYCYATAPTKKPTVAPTASPSSSPSPAPSTSPSPAPSTSPSECMLLHFLHLGLDEECFSNLLTFGLYSDSLCEVSDFSNSAPSP